MTEQKHSKHTTKLYIEHACNHIGTNAAATLLNLKAPRVSDMKIGRRLMTFEESEIIRSEFGLPNMGTGIYVKGELLGKDWHQEYVNNGRVLHFLSAVEAMNSKELLDDILSQCNVDTRNIPEFDRETYLLPDDERKGVEQKNNRLEREEKIKKLQMLLESRDFQEWRAEILRELKVSSSQMNSILEGGDSKVYQQLQKVCNQVDEGFSIFTRLSKNPFPLFNAIGALYSVINHGTYSSLIGGVTEFKLGKNIALPESSSPVQDYVITGRCVWKSDTERLENPMIAPGGLGWMPDIETHHKSNLDMNPGTYLSVNFQIIYTEHHQYYVRVVLSKNEYGIIDPRTLLIQIQDRRTVFDEIFSIFEEFKTTLDISLDELKSSLAINGAYIPGATYIN